MLNVKYELQLLTHNNRLIIQLFLGSEIDSFEDRQAKISSFSGENPVQILSDSSTRCIRNTEILGISQLRAGRSGRCAVVERIGCSRHDLRAQKHRYWLVLPGFYRQNFQEALQRLSRRLGRSLEVTQFRKFV